MGEQNRNTTFKGKPLTLVGKEIRVGEKAPDFEVTDVNLNPVKFSSFKGKTCIISSVISLDTPVCDQQTHKFNESVAKLGKDVVILSLSMDLPFALKRWCGAGHVDQIQALTDYKSADFGKKFGVLIQDWHLLSRAVFLIDRDGVVRYVQYVKEITDQPNFAEVFKHTEQLLEKVGK